MCTLSEVLLHSIESGTNGGNVVAPNTNTSFGVNVTEAVGLAKKATEETCVNPLEGTSHETLPDTIIHTLELTYYAHWMSPEVSSSATSAAPSLS